MSRPFGVPMPQQQLVVSHGREPRDQRAGHLLVHPAAPSFRLAATVPYCDCCLYVLSLAGSNQDAAASGSVACTSFASTTHHARPGSAPAPASATASASLGPAARTSVRWSTNVMERLWLALRKTWYVPSFPLATGARGASAASSSAVRP